MTDRVYLRVAPAPFNGLLRCTKGGRAKIPGVTTPGLAAVTGRL